MFDFNLPVLSLIIVIVNTLLTTPQPLDSQNKVSERFHSRSFPLRIGQTSMDDSENTSGYMEPHIYATSEAFVSAIVEPIPNSEQNYFKGNTTANASLRK